VTIVGDVTSQYANGDAVTIVPTAPARLATVQGTVNSVPAFAAGNTTFNLLAAINATTTGGSIVDETAALAAFSCGVNTVASGKATHAAGDGALAENQNDFAQAGTPFSVNGDVQRKGFLVKGSTPGSVAGETTPLVSGALASIILKPSRAYFCNIKGTATKMGLGAAARQTIGFWRAFEVSTDSAGAVTISAVANVVADIVTGAAFVGATLVPTSGAANSLTLTFAIAGGLTIASRVGAWFEAEEVLGT